MCCLREVDDPRRPSNGALHDFQEILVNPMAAVPSCCDTVQDIAYDRSEAVDRHHQASKPHGRIVGQIASVLLTVTYLGMPQSVGVGQITPAASSRMGIGGVRAKNRGIRHIVYRQLLIVHQRQF